jgi:hypothetical protein
MCARRFIGEGAALLFFFLLWFGCITQGTRAVLDGVKRQRIKLSVGLGLYLVVPRIRVRVKVLICPRAVL